MAMWVATGGVASAKRPCWSKNAIYPCSSVGVSLKDLGLPKGVRIGSIYRNGKMSIAAADDLLRPEDRITLIGARDEIDEYRDWFQKELPPKLGIAIAGGGEFPL